MRVDEKMQEERANEASRDGGRLGAGDIISYRERLGREGGERHGEGKSQRGQTVGGRL